jgi:hypothetical protein
MMDAARLFADLRAAGFDLTADGDRLIVWPASRLTQAQRHAIRENKPGLLACLWAEMLKEHYEERAAILEFDGGIPRAQAEAAARASTGLLARNLGMPWLALRMAFDDPSLPASADVVNATPYGLPAWCLSPGGQPMQQGAYRAPPRRPEA